jgi:hypothetical protein
MRTLVILALLLTIPALSPLPTYGAERTWTIARDVYTAEAELVAVRGNLAFLKIGDDKTGRRVEEVPIDRLSALDQQYIASLSLAPILPGPVADVPDPASDAAIVEEEIPLPGEPDPPASELDLNAPDLAPAYGGEPIRQQSLPRGAYRIDQYGRVIPPQPGVAANYLAPLTEPRAGANPNDRRYRQPSQQGPNTRAANSRGEDEEDRPGLFGARSRRSERQRAAAARSR